MSTDLLANRLRSARISVSIAEKMVSVIGKPEWVRALEGRRARVAELEKQLRAASPSCADITAHDAHDACPGRRAATTTMIGRGR